MIGRDYLRRKEVLMHQTKGRLIVFEGVDGCGKTTQRRMYAEYMRGRGGQKELVTTGEPYGTAGVLIRAVLGGNYPLLNTQEMLGHLFAASRAEHAKTLLRPALEAGMTILCDRYLPSSLAYQGQGYSPDSGWISKLLEMNAGVPVPTLTLVFDVSPETSAERVRARKGTLETFDASSLDEIRARCRIYRALDDYGHVGDFVRINGEVGPDEVHLAVCGALDPIVFGGEG